MAFLPLLTIIIAMNTLAARPIRSSRPPGNPDRRRHILVALWWWDERLLRGIAMYAAGRGWILDTRVRFANRLPIRRKYDGVIVFSGRDKTLQRMARAIHGPIVNLDPHRPVPGSQVVCCDDAGVGAAAAEHFFASKLDRIVFVQMRSRRSASEKARFAGLRSRCKAAGVSVKAIPLNRLRKILIPERMPMGLMAVNDEAAVEVMGICLEAGFRVPDDVSIIGVDNFPAVCLHSPVQLTSVDLNLEQWGLRAAQTLHNLMSESSTTHPIAIPHGGIVARASTDVLHRLDVRVAEALRYMRQNFRGPFKIASLVRHVGASRQALQNYFRQQLHMTMHQQLNALRMNHAMQLLRGTPDGLAQIARASGFRDYQHFHRIFKQNTGQTPSAWRKKKSQTEPRIFGQISDAFSGTGGQQNSA